MTDVIYIMKASLSNVEFLEQIDNDPSWGAGEKFDGFREVLYLDGEHNEMLSSLLNSHIAKVPQFQRTIPELGDTVIDCEGLSPTRYLEDNAACFKADPINTIAWQKTHGDATLVAFDCLRFKGEDCWMLPFEARLQFLFSAVSKLKEIMPIKQEVLVFNHKKAYYESIVARTQPEGHEGIILKKLEAPYQPGKRSGYWLKVKREETLVGTIVGYMEGIGKFAGLVGSLHFICDNGAEGWTSGMDDSTREDMTKNFDSRYKEHKCYIKCQEVTRLKALRHPRYAGLVKEGGK